MAATATGVPLYAAELAPGLGRLELRRVDADVRDVSLLQRWLNANHVRDRFQLDVPRDDRGRYSHRQVREHLKRLHAVDGAHASIGSLDGAQMSYWETYDVGSSPLAGHPQLSGGDRGIHVVVGSPEHVGRGLGAHLLRAVAIWQLDAHPEAARVVAEPNVRNHIAIRAFRRCGFRLLATIELRGKRAAVMALDRCDVPRPGALVTACAGAARGEPAATRPG
jgi:RimJ/RimL family protein N-acetyltransferase